MRHAQSCSDASLSTFATAKTMAPGLLREAHVTWEARASWHGPAELMFASALAEVLRGAERVESVVIVVVGLEEEARPQWVRGERVMPLVAVDSDGAVGRALAGGSDGHEMRTGLRRVVIEICVSWRRFFGDEEEERYRKMGVELVYRY